MPRTTPTIGLKKRLFLGLLRFVRVPPYESWANWTNFYFSCENGDILLSQKSCNLFHTKNEEKLQKISTCIRLLTCEYANTWQGGMIRPPPWIGLMRNSFINIDFCLCFVKSINLQAFCSEMGNERHGTKWMRLYVPWYWRYLHSSCTQSISSHYHFDLFFGSGAWRSEDCTIKTADWNCVCKKTL